MQNIDDAVQKAVVSGMREAVQVIVAYNWHVFMSLLPNAPPVCWTLRKRALYTDCP
jgi:hypothetical protein